MKKIAVVIVLAIFSLIGVSAAIAITNAGNNDKDSQSAVDDINSSIDSKESRFVEGESTVAIDIKDFKYIPETLSIGVGTTVTWTNQDTARHDITPDNDKSFDGSQLLSKGDSYSYTFNEPGTYNYHCSPHPNMTAKVIVE